MPTEVKNAAFRLWCNNSTAPVIDTKIVDRWAEKQWGNQTPKDTSVDRVVLWTISHYHSLCPMNEEASGRIRRFLEGQR